MSNEAQAFAVIFGVVMAIYLGTEIFVLKRPLKEVLFPWMRRRVDEELPLEIKQSGYVIPWDDPEPVKQECGNCKFWAPNSIETLASMGKGWCRRYPPIFEVEQSLNDGWPNTHQQSWCGEWREK